MLRKYTVIDNTASIEVCADKFEVSEDKYIFYKAGRVVGVFTAANVVGFIEKG